MRSKKCAFLLAAGMGNRLQPISSWIPKPLLPLPNQDTLLGTIIERLKRDGIEHFVVNGHHLSSHISDFLAKRPKLSYTFNHEADILGTAGPLVVAKNILAQGDYFLLHNGDILLDVDFKDLMATHEKSGALMTLVALDGPENKLLIDENNQLHDILGKRGKKIKNGRLVTYSGVGVFSRQFFDYLPQNIQNTSLISGFHTALEAGETCMIYPIDQKTYWNDLGTVEKYLDTALHFPDIFTNQTSHASCFEKIAEQGSARSFYRLNVDGKHAILMKSFEGDADFERFIEFGQFLHRACEITPKLFGYNTNNLSVLMEDLGDETLYAYVLKHQNDVHKIQSIYQQVIDTLKKYQENATLSGIETLTSTRLFDYDYLRWETAYFMQHLIGTHLNLNLTETTKANLECEFDALAKNVFAQPKVFIHRDFQSQNIIIHNGKVRFVDFQGGRMGCGAYDLMSLILDPYVQLPDAVQKQAIEYYFQDHKQSISLAIDVGLQRLMQALGAYGFLSHIKGKTKYLSFIPPALEKLENLLLQTDQYPTLKKLVEQIKVHQKGK